MASTTEIAAWTAAVIGPLGTGFGFYLNWLLRKGKQDADIQGKLDSQTAQIESSIADKYAERITKLESQVQDLFNALVDKASEVGELRGQVVVLKEQLAKAQENRDADHLELATLRAKVAEMRPAA